MPPAATRALASPPPPSLSSRACLVSEDVLHRLTAVQLEGERGEHVVCPVLRHNERDPALLDAIFLTIATSQPSRTPNAARIISAFIFPQELDYDLETNRITMITDASRPCVRP